MNSYAFSKTWVPIILIIFIAGGVLVWQYLLKEAHQIEELNLVTTKLAVIPEGYKIYFFPPITFSHDGRKVAYVARKEDEDKNFVVLNNEEGKHYDRISGCPVFSPDGKQLAYVAQQGEIGFIILNNQEGRAYDEVRWPVFSPDGKQLAYVAVNKEGEYFIVLNGQESKTYDEIYGKPVFSEDSKHIAYGAQVGNEPWWIVDEVE